MSVFTLQDYINNYKELEDVIVIHILPESLQNYIYGFLTPGEILNVELTRNIIKGDKEEYEYEEEDEEEENLWDEYEEDFYPYAGEDFLDEDDEEENIYYKGDSYIGC